MTLLYYSPIKSQNIIYLGSCRIFSTHRTSQNLDVAARYISSYLFDGYPTPNVQGCGPEDSQLQPFNEEMQNQIVVVVFLPAAAFMWPGLTFRDRRLGLKVWDNGERQKQIQAENETQNVVTVRLRFRNESVGRRISLHASAVNGDPGAKVLRML